MVECGGEQVWPQCGKQEGQREQGHAGQAGSTARNLSFIYCATGSHCRVMGREVRWSRYFSVSGDLPNALLSNDLNGCDSKAGGLGVL